MPQLSPNQAYKTYKTWVSSTGSGKAPMTFAQFVATTKAFYKKYLTNHAHITFQDFVNQFVNPAIAAGQYSSALSADATDSTTPATPATPAANAPATLPTPNSTAPANPPCKVCTYLKTTQGKVIAAAIIIVVIIGIRHSMKKKS